MIENAVCRCFHFTAAKFFYLATHTNITAFNILIFILDNRAGKLWFFSALVTFNWTWKWYGDKNLVTISAVRLTGKKQRYVAPVKRSQQAKKGTKTKKMWLIHSIIRWDKNSNFPVPTTKSPLATSIGGFVWKFKSRRRYHYELLVGITQTFMSNGQKKNCPI